MNRALEMSPSLDLLSNHFGDAYDFHSHCNN